MLTVENLSKTFRKTPVLSGISLEIPSGCAFSLLGPNGSGKTTLLKCLMGSIAPDETGCIRLEGDADVNGEAYKEKLVYMPQAPVFLPHLSPGEIVALLGRLRGRPAPRFSRLVEDLNMGSFWDRPFGQLSGGMKQKLNILQCFMFDFKIAFLDEPTASLDPAVAYYVKALIKELKNEGRTVVFTSHIMSEVEEVADTMALLENGKIFLEAAPAEFVRDRRAKNLEEALLKYRGTYAF